MSKKLIIVLAALIVLIGGLYLIKKQHFGVMGANTAGVPVATVTTTAVTADTWEVTINAVGSLAAYQGITVTTESSGIIREIAFEAGSRVQAGDILIKLDTGVLEAQLAAAESRADLARITAQRTRSLYESNSSAKAELDTAQAQVKQAQAEVDSIKASLAQKIVRAPFAGRLGVRQVNLGQFIDRGNAIVSLQALDPIYVNFTVPQQRVAELSLGMVVRVTSDALPGQVVEGKITAINPEVDSVSRNVRVQATLANADEKLRPGMFASIAAVLPQQDHVLVVPATAVLYAPYGDSVFVIEDQKDEKTGEVAKILRQQFVRLGRTRGDFVAITGGLKSGQQIVTTGVFKLRNGAPATIDNTLAPAASLTPKPIDS